MRSLLREPLLHFLVLGAAVFALYTAVAPQRAVPAADAVVITQRDVERLRAQFEATWRRQPSEAELSRLIDSQIREEILVREAESLGLDRGDAVVRQRLALKMGFQLESGSEAAQPDDAELEAHLEAHPERFQSLPRIALDQVMLRPDVEAVAVELALTSGEIPDEITTGSLLPRTIPLNPQTTIDGTFGRGFFAEVSDLPEGVWSGPVTSGYGRHLVRILERRPGRVPPLAEIRAEVERDWRATLRARLAEERYATLSARYEVSRPDVLAETETTP